LTGKKLIHGYLDAFRENVAALDEAIAIARKMSKSKKSADRHTAIQALKLIRDLAEVRNQTLLNIKAHILGRNESGAIVEPGDHYEGNAYVEFERDFRNLLTPWIESDLRLECADCGIESEDVSDRYVEKEDRHLDLCEKCHAKRVEDPSGDQTKEAAEDQRQYGVFGPFAAVKSLTFAEKKVLPLLVARMEGGKVDAEQAVNLLPPEAQAAARSVLKKLGRG
jgi:hypothetical protein